jgi:hypothetical protein
MVGLYCTFPIYALLRSLLSDAELDIAEALIAKATGRQPREPETLARIAEA